MKSVLLFLLIFALFAALISAADPIAIQGSPTFTAATASINISFTLGEASSCKGSVDADADYEGMPISFDESNGTFSTVQSPLAEGRHDVFIRCFNENRNLGEPAFYYSLIVIAEDQLPGKVQKKIKIYSPPSSQPQNEYSDYPPTVPSYLEHDQTISSKNNSTTTSLLEEQQPAMAANQTSTPTPALQAETDNNLLFLPAVSKPSNPLPTSFLWISGLVVAVIIILITVIYFYKKSRKVPKQNS